MLPLRESLLDSSRKSSVIVAPVQLVSKAIGLITTIVLARYLTVSEYGIYNLITGSLIIFSLVTNWGLGSALQRFIPEYVRTYQYARLFKTFFFSQGFRAVTGIIAIAITVALFEPMSVFLKIEGFKVPYILFCIGSYAFFQVEFLQVAFNGFLLQKYSALTQLGVVFLQLVLLINFLNAGGNLISVFEIQIITYVLACLVMWTLFMRKVYWPLRFHSEGSATIEKKRVGRFALLSAATIPGGFIFSYALDYFVISAMATSNQLGIYALASRASNMVMSLMPDTLMETVVRPAFYQRYSSIQEKKSELNRMFRSLTVMIAAVMFPVLVLVGIQAGPILTFAFKSKYADSTPIFLIFLAFNTFMVLDLPSDLVLQAIEKVQVKLYAQVFAIYNLGADIILMSKFGLLGVAFATGSALMAKCLFWYFMARRYTGISIGWSALLKIGINTAVAGGIAYGVSLFGNSIIWVFASLASGFFVYVALSLLNPFFDDREKDMVNRFLKRRVFKV